MNALRILLFLFATVLTAVLVWFPTRFSVGPWLFYPNLFLCLYFLWFCFRLLFREGLSYFRRHAWFNSFVAMLPLSIFGIGVLSIPSMMLFVHFAPRPKAFETAPSSEQHLRMIFAIIESLVLLSLSLTTAFFTIRTGASRRWFYAGCAVLIAVGAFRHTHVQITHDGITAGPYFTVQELLPVEWFCLCPIPALLWVYASSNRNANAANHAHMVGSS